MNRSIVVRRSPKMAVRNVARQLMPVIRERTQPVEDIFTATVSQFKLLLDGLTNRPDVLVVLIVTSVLSLSYLASPSSNILQTFLKDLGDSVPGMKPLTDWLLLRLAKALGASWFFLCYLAVGKSIRMYVIIVGALILFMFKGKLLEYILISAALYAFFRMNNKTVRIIAVAIAAGAFYFGAFGNTPLSTLQVDASERL